MSEPVSAPPAAIAGAMRRFRTRRMRLFAETFPLTAETSILDVGGTPYNWLLLDVKPRVTLLNMPQANEPVPEGFDWVSGDGRALPFADKSFDIVFSNSVIEHVGDRAKQREFADEVRRVGRSYWVQTPNRAFPVEPHLLTPFIHWLPRGAQRAIVRRGSVWEWIERPSEDRREYYVEHYLNDIRLLGADELKALFPEAQLLRERSAGMTKSLIACRV